MRAEFCFQRERRDRSEFVCIVLDEKALTGSQEDLDRTLQATLDFFDGYSPCRNDYGLDAGQEVAVARESPRAEIAGSVRQALMNAEESIDGRREVAEAWCGV
jgi:hypothetical protein